MINIKQKSNKEPVCTGTEYVRPMGIISKMQKYISLSDYFH